MATLGVLNSKRTTEKWSELSALQLSRDCANSLLCRVIQRPRYVSRNQSSPNPSLEQSRWNIHCGSPVTPPRVMIHFKSEVFVGEIEILHCVNASSMSPLLRL